MFTVAFSKYEEGNEVVFYADMKGQDKKETDSQKFTANSNGTISPLKAPDLVLGMEATSGTWANSIYEIKSMRWVFLKWQVNVIKDSCIRMNWNFKA